jgi:HEAT repeat protein
VTFDVLAEGTSSEASDALLAAVSSEDAVCRKLGSQSIIRQRSQLSILNLMKQVDELSDDVVRELSSEPVRFVAPLRQCFQRDEKHALRTALVFARRCGCIGQFAEMIPHLEHRDDDVREAASDAIRSLAEELALRLMSEDESHLPGIDLDTARRLRVELLGELSRVVSQFDELANPVPLIDAILMLGRPEEEHVRNLCSKYGDDCATLVAESLRTLNSRPVFAAICEAQKMLSPMPVFNQTLSNREDPEFVLFLLEWMPKRVSSLIDANIKRAAGLPWLSTEHPTLQQIPDELHDRLIAVVNSSHLDRDERNDIKKWVVRNSSGAGRAAASDVFNWLPRKEAQHILYEALVDVDADVEAWATRYLRSQQVPDTFQQLLQRLDSDRLDVLDAARGELASFNLELVFDLFESLPRSTCLRCGEVLQKIHPGVLDEFRGELSHPFHWRRVRAARAVGELGLVDELLPALTALLRQSEWSVRRAVIEALAMSDSDAGEQIIRSMARDEQRQVREAVVEALATIQERRDSGA